MKNILKLENMSACTETLAGAVSMPGLPAVAAAINTGYSETARARNIHTNQKKVKLEKLIDMLNWIEMWYDG